MLLTRSNLANVVGVVRSQMISCLLSAVTAIDCSQFSGASAPEVLVGRAVHGGAVSFQGVDRLKE